MWIRIITRALLVSFIRSMHLTSPERDKILQTNTDAHIRTNPIIFRQPFRTLSKIGLNLYSISVSIFSNYEMVYDQKFHSMFWCKHAIKPGCNDLNGRQSPHGDFPKQKNKRTNTKLSEMNSKTTITFLQTKTNS